VRGGAWASGWFESVPVGWLGDGETTGGTRGGGRIGNMLETDVLIARDCNGTSRHSLQHQRGTCECGERYTCAAASSMTGLGLSQPQHAQKPHTGTQVADRVAFSFRRCLVNSLYVSEVGTSFFSHILRGKFFYTFELMCISQAKGQSLFAAKSNG